MATSTHDARLAVAVLVQDTARSPSQRKHALSWAPVEAITGVAHALGLEVVAEGVETAVQL
jgi:EAL domain-containing protein (putative c-di-GMP-specific phosphodiesterase class I)